jgi:rhodanese-related sulfurtransferase
MSLLPPITPSALKELLAGAAPPRLLDVREPHEWTSELGHIEGAELIPMRTVPEKLAALKTETREIISICKSGMRAGNVAELLAKNGVKVRVLQGGMMAWNAAGLPITRAP